MMSQNSAFLPLVSISQTNSPGLKRVFRTFPYSYHVLLGIGGRSYAFLCLSFHFFRLGIQYISSSTLWYILSKFK